MLKIGEFSRLSQVTIKTLHHYDELGLIKPVHIDPVTNYRFYTVEQLPRIHRIMASNIGRGFERWVLLHRWTVAQGFTPRPILIQVAHRGPLHTFNIREWVLEAQIPVDSEG